MVRIVRGRRGNPQARAAPAWSLSRDTSQELDLEGALVSLMKASAVITWMPCVLAVFVL
jgi:hypothetical protein